MILPQLLESLCYGKRRGWLCIARKPEQNLAMQQYILDCFKKEISKIRDIKDIEGFFFFF